MTRQNVFSRSLMVSLVGVLSFGTVSCGFIFAHGPPDGYEQMPSFDCTPGNTAALLDLVWGGLNVAGAAAAANNPREYDRPGQIVTVGVSWAVISGVSAVAGFSKSARCRAARLQMAQKGAAGAPRAQPLYGDSIVQAVVVQPALDTVAVGQQVQLVASAHNSSGSVVPDQLFVWSSSNDAVASVGVAGLVTAHAPGSVVISVRAAGVVGTTSVVVVPQR